MRALTALLSISSVALVLPACSGPPARTSAGGGSYSGLIGASYPNCEVDGQALAIYLSTGNPTTDDLNWGDQREEALSLSGQRQAVFIRQTADEYIQNCDENQAQAAASSAAAASAAASARRGSISRWERGSISVSSGSGPAADRQHLPSARVSQSRRIL